MVVGQIGLNVENVMQMQSPVKELVPVQEVAPTPHQKMEETIVTAKQQKLKDAQVK